MDEAVIPKYKSQDDKVGPGNGGTSRLFASLTPQLVATLCCKTESNFLFTACAATPRVFQLSQAVRTSEMTVNCLSACGTQPLIPAGCSNDSVVVEGS